MKEKVVLAYSGGLDTSVAIRWLMENYDHEVITVTVDLGQAEDLDRIAERAKAIGSTRHYSIDAQTEFAERFILPAIKANAFYESKYPLSTALGRPLLATKLVEIAELEGASAVAHGCTGKGNDQVRFDVTIHALNPDLKIIAPVREWNLSRDEELRYAKKNGMPIPAKSSVYSVDQNLWGRSIEGGPLENPFNEPGEDVFEWVSSPNVAPDRLETIVIEFDKGVPAAIDEEKFSLVKLIQFLNHLAGTHGVGVIDHIESRTVGIKSREVYECPAAVVLVAAHQDLEKMVLTRHELEFKRTVEEKWSWLIYSGLWIEPLREELELFIESTQERVTGKVKIKLFKGSMNVVGRESDYSLYESALSTYSSSSTFNQRSSEGFIEIWGLASRTARVLSRKIRSLTVGRSSVQ